jgi:hypothetical protein
LFLSRLFQFFARKHCVIDLFWIFAAEYFYAGLSLALMRGIAFTALLRWRFALWRGG